MYIPGRSLVLGIFYAANKRVTDFWILGITIGRGETKNPALGVEALGKNLLESLDRLLQFGKFLPV